MFPGCPQRRKHPFVDDDPMTRRHLSPAIIVDDQNASGDNCAVCRLSGSGSDGTVKGHGSCCTLPHAWAMGTLCGGHRPPVVTQHGDHKNTDMC